MGDFNFPKLSWDGTDLPNNDFMGCTRDAFLIQKVRKPTRERKNQKSNILDLIFVNEDSIISDIEHQDPFGKSDHQTLVFDLDQSCLP